MFCCAGLVLCFWAASTIRDGGRSPATAEAVSVSVGRVEYDGDTGFVHQRLILRTASTAPMFNTTGETCDSSNGLFWIRTPDGDVYNELLRVPPLTGSVWLNERNVPILTTMTPAGHHLRLVYEFGVQGRITLSLEVIVRSVLGAQEAEDTKNLSPGDDMVQPLLDARVLIIQRKVRRIAIENSAMSCRSWFTHLWAGWPVAGNRTLFWCCKFMSEHAQHRIIPDSCSSVDYSQQNLRQKSVSS